MNNKFKWKVLDEIDVSPSKWFPVTKQKIQISKDKIIDDYFLGKLGDVSMIVALTKNKEIVFVSQYKHGLGEFTIELPAGRIDKREDKLDCAKREFVEETGYEVVDMIEFGFVSPQPTKSTQKTYGFIGKVDKRINQNFDDNEDIDVLLIPTREVNEYIKNNKIVGSDTIAIIKLAELKYPDLFK